MTNTTATHIITVIDLFVVGMWRRQCQENNNSEDTVSSQSEEDIFLAIVLKDYGNVINNQEPVVSNLEYMQMIEYLFLLKKCNPHFHLSFLFQLTLCLVCLSPFLSRPLSSIRELTASKLYQSFTASGTVTLQEENIKKRKGVDFKDLVHRKVANF
jgi:hypothetical protein